jgi:hypothetical protein
MQCTVYFPDKLNKQIREQAKKSGKSFSGMIAEGMEFYLRHCITDQKLFGGEKKPTKK